MGTWLRRLGVGLLASLLLVTLVSANLVIGIDRTVVDSEFVTESLAAEDVYVVAVDEMQTQIATAAQGDPALDHGAETEQSAQGDSVELAQSGGPMAGLEDVLDEVVTPAYVQDQVEANVVRLYDYLHGREDELVLEVDLVPLKERLAPEMAATFTEDLSTVDPTLAAMVESEAAFHAEREAFAAQQMERIQAETEEELSDEELRARYDEQRPEIRDRLLDAAAEQHGGDEEVPPELESALYGLAVVRVDGLVGVDVTYESFTRDVEDARDEFSGAVEPVLAAEIDDGMPDRLDLTDGMDAQSTATVETARAGVSLLGTLTDVLPFLALGLAGLVHWGTRTRSGGLLVVGSTTVVTGLGWVAGLTMAQRTLTTEIDAAVATGSMNPELAGAILGVAGRLLGVFATQSWVLLGVGGALVLGGVGVRRDILPVADRPSDAPRPGPSTGDDPAPVTVAPEMDGETPESVAETEAPSRRED